MIAVILKNELSPKDFLAWKSSTKKQGCVRFFFVAFHEEMVNPTLIVE